MNYSEILSSLGLVVEEYSQIPSLKELFDESFIKTFEELYLKAQNKSKELVQNTLNYVDNNTNLVLAYNNEINNLEKKSLEEISSFQNEYENEKESYLIQIEASKKKYENLNKKIKIENVKKDNITKNAKLSREIETDNKKEIIKSKEKPNADKYNYFIGVFNNTADIKYNKFHSSLSKSQYDLINSSKSYQKKLEELDTEISNKIDNYKRIIIDEETKLNDEIKQIETELNKKISEIQSRYNSIIKQNNEQYKLEINSNNVDINKIEESYKIDVQNINFQARKRLVAIDKKYTAKENDLKQKIQDKKYLNNIKSSLGKNQIQQTKESLKNKDLTHSDRVSLKNKYKVDMHKYQFEKKVRENEIKVLEHRLENLSNDIKKEKREVEIWRQYNINIKTIDKDVKVKPLEESIETKTREKNHFDSIQRHQQAKEINNEKRNINILVLKKKKDFDSYSAKVQIEINKLQIEHLKNLKNQEIRAITEQEVIKYNQNCDLTAEKYYFNQSLYNIEKNKYLLEYNNILIDYELKKIELEKNNSDEIDNIELDRYTKIANETINFNNNSALYYENILEKFIDNARIHLNGKISFNEIEKYNCFANYKYNLQLSRSKADLQLLSNHIDYINFLFQTFIPLFLDQLNKSLNFFDEPSDIFNTYFTSICEHIVMIINKFLKIEIRILQDHIQLDTGIKYSSIYSSANYEYKQKLNAYKSQIDNYNNTNNNYKKTINEFYRRINELNYRQNKLLSNPNENHIKNELQDIKKKISDYQAKNRKNREKIDSFEKQINFINEKINVLETRFSKKIKAIKRKEIIDSEDSNKTITKFNDSCQYYISLINTTDKTEFVSKLMSYKNKNARFLKFNKHINKQTSKMITSLHEIVNSYNNNLKKSLDNIKESNLKNYIKNRIIANELIKKDLNTSNHEYIRLKHQFEDNLIFHKNNLFSINKSSNILLMKEKNIFEEQENIRNFELDKNHNKYFLRFKSCDDLIRYSTNNYNMSLKHYDYIKQNSIKNHTKLSYASCLNESKTFEQVIERYKNEIVMIPRLTTNQIYEINVLTDEKNKELDNVSKELNESIKKYKEENLVNISNYLTQKEKEKANERKNYRNSIKSIRSKFEKKQINN